MTITKIILHINYYNIFLVYSLIKLTSLNIITSQTKNYLNLSFPATNVSENPNCFNIFSHSLALSKGPFFLKEKSENLHQPYVKPKVQSKYSCLLVVGTSSWKIGQKDKATRLESFFFQNLKPLEVSIYLG